MTGIRFLTRQGCPLCDEALAEVRPIAAEAGVPIDIIDIDLDLALLEIYNERVPVIEWPDGSVIAEGIIAPQAVESALQNR
ncbi:MAG: glutaredoxin family protein [Armatimonadetes bacterium]|nr:MAG: glutaredoxin family protein [Armatimonadota bacterium]